MLSVDDLLFFKVLGSAASLASAARLLNVSPSAVTQRLANLEGKLGARLIHRAGRHKVLTDEGVLLAQRASVILEEIEALNDEFAARRGAAVGHLRVIAPFGFGRTYVAPAIAHFRTLHPKVTAELVLKESIGRHPRDTWDIAVHIGALRDSSLILQRIAPNRRLLCASPDYLAKAPPLGEPSDLARHSCLALRENDEDVTMWRFTGPHGAMQAVRVTPRLSTNDGSVLRSWALSGQGIIVRSEWDVAADVHAGRLVSLLPDYRLPDADVVLLLGSRGGKSARTRLFAEHIRAVLAPPPWRAATAASSVAPALTLN